jgi:hypothetical protein
MAEIKAPPRSISKEHTKLMKNKYHLKIEIERLKNKQTRKKQMHKQNI